MRKKMAQASQRSKITAKPAPKAAPKAKQVSAAPRKVPQESGVEKFMDIVSPGFSKIRKLGNK